MLPTIYVMGKAQLGDLYSAVLFPSGHFMEVIQPPETFPTGLEVILGERGDYAIRIQPPEIFPTGLEVILGERGDYTLITASRDISYSKKRLNISYVLCIQIE